ncbi:MAG: LysR family transcriptional regulator [Sphingopyxis sp.]
MKRTHLPLNAMRVFDAAARHLNFTRAADELAVTPAAVGQQIRALEDVLGLVLFRRTPKGLELTAEAEAGLEGLRGGFLQFEESVQAMRAGQSSHSLTIAAPRDMTALWLLPRLMRVAAADPNLRFRLLAADQQLDFTEANLDLAIRRVGDAGELEGTPIDDGAMVNIAPADGPGPFAICWGEVDTIVDENAAVLHVGDAGLAIDAVLNGLGQARVPALLVVNAIAAGTVVETGERTPCSHTYWLVAPAPQWRQKKVKALVAALMGS